ncbi:cyclin-dependent kinase inhibitor 1C-like [Zeugodacus cucurbitae]|uniref:cyclin-dependent kinase inhibitor 1C-like n=1 Tax=Zeugodacus cucurbitae TaxID=28588 RepID=UPI0010A74041|nr:cyclin-dependent kinase inhibitor 1C-like [Zeugodacus cucurbitae]
MKFFAAAAFIATLAFVSADVSELGYGYQQPAASAPSNQYIPPAANAPEPAYAPAPAPAPVYQPAPSAPVSSHIPPAANAPEPAYAPAPAPPYAPQPAASEVYEQPAQDGYRYRTVRRRVYKQRRF